MNRIGRFVMWFTAMALLALVVGGLVLERQFIHSMTRQRGAIAVLDSVKDEARAAQAKADSAHDAADLTSTKIDTILAVMRQMELRRERDAKRRFARLQADIDSVQEALPKKKK